MDARETRLFENLKALTQLRGVSGCEDAVREYIANEIKGYADSVTVNPLGVLIAEKKGKARSAKRLMMTAHMDEVGFTVTHIEDNGMLRFTSVGGVTGAVSSAQAVLVGKDAIPGVIGAVPIHLEDRDKLDTFVKMDKKFIDIGAKSKEEAEKLVELGDMVTFIGEYRELGGGKFTAKAIDDRAGCAMLISLIQSELPYDCTFAFTVQEETGLAGAHTAGFTLRPDVAIAVESTTAADMPGVSGDKKVCRQGKGAVISFMDRGTIYPRDAYKRATAKAEEMGLPWQIKELIAGGNECRTLMTSGDGAKVLAVSLPVRYIHSASSVCDSADVLVTHKLLAGLIEDFGKAE